MLGRSSGEASDAEYRPIHVHLCTNAFKSTEEIALDLTVISLKNRRHPDVSSQRCRSDLSRIIYSPRKRGNGSSTRVNELSASKQISLEAFVEANSAPLPDNLFEKLGDSYCLKFSCKCIVYQLFVSL